MATKKLACGCDFIDRKPDETIKAYVGRVIEHTLSCDEAKRLLWESRRRSESKDEQKPV